jgi:hypothetical protein
MWNYTPKMLCKYEVERGGEGEVVSKLGLGGVEDVKSREFFTTRQKIAGDFDHMLEVLQRELKRFEVSGNEDGGGKGSGSGCIEIWVKGKDDNK